MEWINSLFTDTASVAHVILIFAIVIAAGVCLGKIKVGGISLGVTFVLFMGILVGHIYNNWLPGGGFACPDDSRGLRHGSRQLDKRPSV